MEKDDRRVLRKVGLFATTILCGYAVYSAFTENINILMTGIFIVTAIVWGILFCNPWEKTKRKERKQAICFWIVTALLFLGYGVYATYATGTDGLIVGVFILASTIFGIMVGRNC